MRAVWRAGPIAFALSVWMSTAAAAQPLRFVDHLDLNDPADNLRALVKVRAALDPTQEKISC
jgi:hypothetical protein